MYEVQGTHGLCVECGALLHVPWCGGSSVGAVAFGIGERFREGCAVCGGYLRRVVVKGCPACAELMGDGLEDGWASDASGLALTLQ